MKSSASVALLVAGGLWVSACQPQNSTDPTGKPASAERPSVTEKAFVAGGSIEMQLAGGGYEIRAATDNHIRVTLNGNRGNATTELTSDGAHANLEVKDTPHNNFHATIEVPPVADLVIHLSGGELAMAAITGNKNVESAGGNIKIAVGDPEDYSSVDASVKAGDIDASAFGGSRSGLLQHFTWTGHGKYKLTANLGAGNVVLSGK